MRLLTGKDEIVCLLRKVVARYEQTTHQEVILNTNRKNYEGLARVLSDISVQLPNTAAESEHDVYAPDTNEGREYPYRKYDITAGQVKDAYAGIVTNPRSFLVDACYIYLFGKGRKGFEKDPVDADLLRKTTPVVVPKPSCGDHDAKYEALQQRLSGLEQEKLSLQQNLKLQVAKVRKRMWFPVIILTFYLAFAPELFITSFQNGSGCGVI